MSTAINNNLLEWIRRVKNNTIRQLVFPGLKLGYHGICDCFVFSLLVLPSYFGIRLGFFDLTAVRFFEVLLLICIWKKKPRRDSFINIVRHCPHTFFIGLYFFIVVYTNLYHPSIGTIFYWLMNGIFTFYLISYLIITEYGIYAFLYRIRVFTGLLILLSPLELVLGKSPFTFLDTLGKSITASRFSNIRIVGNCTTANGYGLLLCILLPLLCWDENKRCIDVLKHKYIVVLLLANVFLTGGRLGVGSSLLILFLCFIAQPSHLIKINTIYLVLYIAIACMLAYVFRDRGVVRSMLCSFFSAVDQIFKTNYSVSFGADPEMLAGSAHYRDVLVQNTFFGGWLNPVIGRGGNYSFSVFAEGYNIQSVDNFYVGQYITYAWPGLVAWLLMSISFLFAAIKSFINNNRIMWLAIVSVICYYISLWYLDQLQTYPIMFMMFSFIYGSSNLSKYWKTYK